MGQRNVLPMQFRPTENRSEPSFHGSYVELVLLPVADPRGVSAEEEEEAVACVDWHSTRRIGGAMQRVLRGIMSVRGRSEEDLATLSRRLSRRRREGECSIWKWKWSHAHEVMGIAQPCSVFVLFVAIVGRMECHSRMEIVSLEGRGVWGDNSRCPLNVER